MEQLGDGVGAHPGVPFQYPGCFRGRGDTEHGATLGVQVVDGGGEHAGLARTSRADHQHEPVLPRHRRCCLSSATHRGRCARRSSKVPLSRPVRSIAQVMMCSSSASTASDVNRGAVGSVHKDRPSEFRRCVALGGSRSTQRSSIRSAACSIAAAQRCPDICDTGRCRSQIARTTSARPHDERSADIASTTSRDGQRVGRGTVAGGAFDLLDELFDGPADLCRLALPSCRQIGDTEPGLAAPGVGRGFTFQGGMLLR